MKILEIITSKRLLGNFGEREAVKYLRRQGYKILKRNFVASGNEIDIIAQKSDTIAFVEVKTRTEGSGGRYEPRPAASVTPEKQRKIIKVASFFNGYNPNDKKLRFDVIEVYTRKENGKTKLTDIKHLISAFDKNSAFANGYRDV